jgi:aspartate/methionine/tyrosine aminotransferase
MRYRRMPIEVESPEEHGYDLIDNNLAESSVSDMELGDLGVDLDELVLAYGDHRGTPELREQVAAEDPALVPDDVLVTAGAAGALFIVNSSLLAAGDHAVIEFPNYATNLETPLGIGAHVERYELRYEDAWAADPERLEALIRPETRLVSLTTPHNPTGAVLEEEDLRRIVSAVERTSAILLVDETYREMSTEPTPLASTLSDRAISVSGMSKSFGMPGIRVGWITCRDPGLMEVFLAAREQIGISGSLVDEAIACAALRRKAPLLRAITRHVDANRLVLKAWIEERRDLEWVEPRAGATCFARIRDTAGLRLDRFYEVLLGELRTWVGPGHWFGFDDRYMRIGFGWPTQERLRAGLEAISEALRRARG